MRAGSLGLELPATGELTLLSPLPEDENEIDLFECDTVKIGIFACEILNWKNPSIVTEFNRDDFC
mgnify:CR=1 FL=1